MHARGLQGFRAGFVIRVLPAMLLSVDLDHQLCGVTVEVDDIAVDWNLALEFGRFQA